MKNWARWTLLILWTLGLIASSTFWNPFVSFPALLKYVCVSVVGAAIFGALIMLIQYYILLSVIFPLPPRADSKAPKSIWRRMFKFLFKDSLINPKAPKTLDELIGNDLAKMEIREVVDMLAHPEKYKSSGADLPKGMLFVGAPGVGKTLFARAIANEVGIPFYVVEGSNLSGLFFGLGVFKLRILFHKLRRHEKCILFIDEIESMGQRRQADRGMGAQSDMNMTLNTFLTEMDGFHASSLLFIGATNNDGVLDPALVRSGRMDRRIYFQLPSPEERKDLFRYYMSKVLCDPGIDLDELVMLTAGSSPADIANVVNEAALISLRPGGPSKVTTEMIKQALERVSIGAEGRVMGSDLEVQSADPSIRLADVIGIDDVMQDVAELIDFLKKGEQLRSIGARIPRGILMIGPPGVGKTMLAKAIANEAGVPFFGISASRLQSMWKGEGAGRIRALYAQARKSPSCIIFIDEIDALAGTMKDTGNERTSELNQILIELDGMAKSRNVITIGATNEEQSLDPAFMRSGRFDRKVYVGLPHAEARRKIFEKYLNTVKLHSQPDLDKLAKMSVNFSGADIAACVNEAAMLAIRYGKEKVEESDLEEAVAKISITAGHKLNTSGMSLARVPDLDVKLDDIKGMEEAKAEAAEVVAMLKNMHLLEETGLKAPKGVLLIGAPGTGKTMLAKAIANEAGVPFYALSGSDFVQVWVGLGAQRVRTVYEQARRSGKPAIVFIDEIDALGHSRGPDRASGGKQEHNQTLNQFLVELDGFGKHKVLTIGATNNGSLLDPAMLRPGRFDRQIDIPLPNLEGRHAILDHYLSKVKTDTTVNSKDVARMTVWKSGADIANIVNEAGLMAMREGRTKLSQLDLIAAVERQSFGMSYSRHVLMEELSVTAHHEAGHAVVAYFRNKRERIQVVTIVPRGGALGYVWSIDKEERWKKNKMELMVDIEISIGSWVAEHMFFETNAWGVSEDLRNVSRLARSMVRQWGMGDFTFNTDSAFGDASPETEREIEMQTKKIIDECRSNVEKLLQAHRGEVQRLAQALLEKETLYYKDVASILDPKRPMAEIEREMEQMAERKLVGKAPVVNLQLLGGLGLGGHGGSDPGAPGGSSNNDTQPEQYQGDLPQ